MAVQLPWAYQRQKSFEKVIEAAAKLQARQLHENPDK
jgi:hypothetical protein